MNRKFLIALAGVTALSATAVAVYAAGGRDFGPRVALGPGPEMGFVHPGLIAPFLMHGLSDELQLTGQQRETIKGLMESSRPNMQAMRKEIRDGAALLRKTQPDDPNYSMVVAQVSEKAAELASRLVNDGSQLRSQVWNVLTPEQRTQFQTLQTKFQERARERRLHHRGPRPDAPPANAKSEEAAESMMSAVEVPLVGVPTIVVTATRIRV